jgi:DNA polymerase III alpha subunit
MFDMDDDLAKDDAEFELPSVFSPLSRQEQMAAEKELLGLYLSDHPLDQFAEKLKGLVTHTCDEARSAADREMVKIAGVITNVRPYYTRAKNEQMFFLTIEDKTGSIAVTLFPRGAAEYGGACVKDSVVLVEGRVSYRERINTTAPAAGESGGGGIAAELSAERIVSVANVDEVRGSQNGSKQNEHDSDFEQIHIRLLPTHRAKLETLRNILKSKNSETQTGASVHLHLMDHGKNVIVEPYMKITPNNGDIDYIRSILGSSELVWVK